MSNLGQRVGSAAVLIPILVAALFWDPTHWSILAIATLAAALAQDELLRMGLGDADEFGRLRALNVVAGAAVMVGVGVFGARALGPSLSAGVAVLSAAVLFDRSKLDAGGRHLAVALGSLVYVPVLACAWAPLKGEFGGAWLFVTLATAFGSDSAAYFAGRALGRRKLYPEVSPNKTWAGAIGGVAGGVGFALGFGSLWLIPELPWAHALVLGALGSVLGQIGDLVESLIKRTFGVKDSGRILPGHGGMLDRVDALLFVAPLYYYYASLMRG